MTSGRRCHATFPYGMISGRHACQQTCMPRVRVHIWPFYGPELGLCRRRSMPPHGKVPGSSMLAHDESGSTRTQRTRLPQRISLRRSNDEHNGYDLRIPDGQIRVAVAAVASSCEGRAGARLGRRVGPFTNEGSWETPLLKSGARCRSQGRGGKQKGSRFSLSHAHSRPWRLARAC